MKKLLLQIPILLFGILLYAQEETSGMVSYGGTYLYKQSRKVDENGRSVSDFNSENDTLKTNFVIALNTSENFLTIKNVDDLPMSFIKFDSLEVEDVYGQFKEFELTDQFDQKGLTQLNTYKVHAPYNFTPNANGDIIIPSFINFVYDPLTDEISLKIIFTVNGNNFNYTFIINEVQRLNFSLPKLYKKVINLDQATLFDNMEKNKDDAFASLDYENRTIELTDDELILTKGDKELKRLRVLYRDTYRGKMHIYTLDEYYILPIWLKNGEFVIAYYRYDEDLEDYKNVYSYKINTE